MIPGEGHPLKEGLRQEAKPRYVTVYIPGEGHPLKEGLRQQDKMPIQKLIKPGEGHPLKEGLRHPNFRGYAYILCPERVIH